MYVREKFRPVLLAANATFTFKGTSMGGFLAKTAGTVSVSEPQKVDGSAGDLLIDAVPVTAGVYTPMPFQFDHGTGAVLTLGGGASGTLAV